MKFRHLRYACLIVFLIVLYSCRTSAQSIGFDYGISGIQNFSGTTNSTYGFSLIIPFNEKCEGIFSFHTWNGEDMNYTYAKRTNQITYPNARKFYGNKAFNLLINYKYLSIGDLSFLFGLGISQLEMLESTVYDQVHSTYYGAFTILPVYIKYKLTDRIGIFSRGSLSAKGFEFVPDWGTLNLGIEIKPF